ncbi:MAG: RNA polymerase sigma factor [Pyrinomonadaceae bacterium]|nr:RNA polymerase sigma factor [Acidobacteriota bacterium]MBP7377738.1 RNA polymerase sigma factor [Pyrinomonadaceae bacterium]
MFEEVINISLQREAQLPTIEFADDAPITDERLVQMTLAGDETAFAEIFERYKRPMTKVVARYFRERSEIEEFVQQCFTKAYFSLKNFRGGEDRSFAAWMTRIAVNVCYDEFRRRGRKGESLFSEMSDAENDYVTSVIDGREPTADRSIIASQLAERVLSSLDPKDRIAMTLVYSEDYSLGEAADAIGITTSNLKSRLFRCRNQIRTRFGHLFR